ncbi:hypothetical protein HDV06_006585 [Boothiomyces sp. JEL0866]|nr:hypothetical protein HDV06_006585 [Boothiomyces sp. JEL0866]
MLLTSLLASLVSAQSATIPVQAIWTIDPADPPITFFGLYIYTPAFPGSNWNNMEIGMYVSPTKDSKNLLPLNIGKAGTGLYYEGGTWNLKSYYTNDNQSPKISIFASPQATNPGGINVLQVGGTGGTWQIIASNSNYQSSYMEYVLGSQEQRQVSVYLKVPNGWFSNYPQFSMFGIAFSADDGKTLNCAKVNLANLVFSGYPGANIQCDPPVASDNYCNINNCRFNAPKPATTTTSKATTTATSSTTTSKATTTATSSTTTTTTTTSKATTTTSKTTLSATPSPTCASPVGAWGQCGGNGYSASTCCQAGYSCIKSSDWWSSCQLNSASAGTVAAWGQCAEKNYWEFVSIAIHFNAVDVSVKSNKLLYNAVKCKQFEIIKLLVKHPRFKNEDLNETFDVLMRNSETRTARYLIENLETNLDLEKYFINACQFSNQSFIIYLLEMHNFDPKPLKDQAAEAIRERPSPHLQIVLDHPKFQ